MIAMRWGCMALALALCSCNPTSDDADSILDAPDASSESAQDAIAQHKVIRGMTADEVILSWGHPRKINRSEYSTGVEEQWVYGDYLNAAYVYLRNGRVTAIQYAGYNPGGNAQASSSGSTGSSSGGGSGSGGGGSGTGTGNGTGGGGVFVD